MITSTKAKNISAFCAAAFTLFATDTMAATFDAYVKCQKEYRPKLVSTSEPNTTIVAMESYLSCKIIYWPRPESDGVPPRDGGIGGPSGPNGKKDISDMSCDALDANRKALKARSIALNAERDSLDIALNNAFAAHDVAEATARAARTKSDTDTLQCDNLADLDETARRMAAFRKCHSSRTEIYEECMDRQMALPSNTPASNAAKQACSMATQSESDARRADNAERLAHDQVVDIWDQRADTARELGRIQRQLALYNAEYKNRCP